MAEIRVERVAKSFGDKIAVKDVNLTIKDREFMVLLGPSGCGKTTLLRAIAGLGMADAGRIAIGGRDVTYQPPGQRNISMVFQSYAIFPHMTVRDNIGFGLKMNKVDKSTIRKRIEEAAELLHIEELLDRRPSAMSGGQRQRVAVARAIAMQAKVLLMDEPLSNLDALLRLEMRAELKRLLADVDATTVYVTHDQIEALSMGDRVAVMRDGEIQQCDAPNTVYESPTNRFVGSFIGNPPMNFLEGNIKRTNGLTAVEVAKHEFSLTPETQSLIHDLPGNKVTLGIRAENMETLLQPTPETVAVNVEVVEPLGAQNLLTVSVGGHRLKVSTHPTLEVATDQVLHIRFPANQIRWIDPTTNNVLYAP